MKKVNKKILAFVFLFLLVCSSSSFQVSKATPKKDQELALAKTITPRKIKQLAVFIKFSDSDTNVLNHIDDTESVENAYKLYNSEIPIEMNTVNGIIGVPSFKKYFERESYGSLSITTEILPKKNNQVIAFKDSEPIGYYLKYSENNKIGYKDKNEALKRETELINRVIAYLEKESTSYGINGNELDTNQDNFIDAISFIVEGQKNLPSTISWGELLWAHERDNEGITQTLLGKKIRAYNLIYAEDYKESASIFSLNRGTYGTLIHEFGHTLGYKDLYRYGAPNEKPVGFYDIMGNAIGSNPQSFLTYFISDYQKETNWHNPIPVVSKTTTNLTLYKPKFQNKDELRAIKIATGENKKEYFIVEYHDKMNTYDSYSALESGLIVYRVNENYKYLGNAPGEDHLYVFRPNETNLMSGLGDLSKATLNMKRPVLGKNEIATNTNFDNQTIFYSNGKNSGIKIEVTGETTDSITFNILLPTIEGEGSKEKPYLIKDEKMFLYLMSLDTKNKYYQIENDLDFKEIATFPSLSFEGNLEGKNYTLRNIKTSGSGLFNTVGHFSTPTKIENLNIENIVVHSTKQNYLGGFANVAENITLKNIHLKSGSVTREGEALNDLISVGGFVGNVNDQTTITNCSTTLDVSAPKNVGGFIGLNQNAKIENSFSTGTVKGEKNRGGFIGLQAISYGTYQIPKQVYYVLEENENLSGVGGYAKNFHDLNLLDEASLAKGISSLYFPKTMNLVTSEKKTLPFSIQPSQSLNYQVSIEKTDLIRYENNELLGLKAGTSKINIEIRVGNRIILLNSRVTIEENDFLTEEKVLTSLGLRKKEQYVLGIPLHSNIKEFIDKVNHLNGVTLKNFKNSENIELKEGSIATGMTFTLNFKENDYSYRIVIKGDVNGDGKIYATDYVKVKNHIMGKSSLTGPYLIAADINEDDKIYATDYVQIKNHIMGRPFN